MTAFRMLSPLALAGALSLSASGAPAQDAPLPSTTRTYVIEGGGCRHGGHELMLSWIIEPAGEDAGVRVSIDLGEGGRAIARHLESRGRTNFAVTYPSRSELEITIDFFKQVNRANARASIQMPYPDTISASVEAEGTDPGLRGSAIASLRHCPPLPAPPPPTDAEVEREEREIARSLDLERAEDEPAAIIAVPPGRIGGGMVPPGLGIAAPGPAFDRAAMATCIERAMFDAGAIGYSYAVVVDRFVHSDATDAGGWARSPSESVQPSVPVTLPTRMTIASISKPITAMAVMRLIERGDLDLGDAFYPLVEDQFPSAGTGVDAVTIRELLTHSSGLKPNYCGKTADSINSPATFSNGYQNINYCILREVVESVSGQDYVNFVRSEILAPSGIATMSCEPESATPTRYYADDSPGSPGADWTSSDYAGLCGAYGWYASATDLARLLAHFRNNTFLSGPTAASMRNECVGSLCLGLKRYSTSQGPAFGHGGAWIKGGGQAFRGAAISFPRGIDAVLLTNTNIRTVKDILKNAYEDAFRGGCVPPPEPPGPPTCPPSGCGTVVNASCAPAGVYPDGTFTPITASPFLSQNHPDGDATFDEYCENYPEVTDYHPAAPAHDLVCNRAPLSGGTYTVCKACGLDGKFYPGCECPMGVADACGPDLTCVPSTGYNDTAASYGTGRCWSDTAGVPSWECQGNCNAVYGGSGYCYHGALPWEGAGGPICASTLCNIAGKECAQQGLFCNTDTGACEVECNGAVHNPAQGLFSCQGRGHGPEFACNSNAQRCFVAGVEHP